MNEVPDISTISIEEILNLPEGQYFDRKSAKIDVKKVATALISFANADGGLIAIGVNNGKFEGISGQNSIKNNDFIQCKMTHCTPAIRANECFLEVINNKGQKDHILLIQIEPSSKMVHKTMADEVFLRVGDESIKLNHEQRLNFEYDKGERLFEEQIAPYCTINDLDTNVLKSYSEAVHYTDEV